MKHARRKGVKDIEDLRFRLTAIIKSFSKTISSQATIKKRSGEKSNSHSHISNGACACDECLITAAGEIKRQNQNELKRKYSTILKYIRYECTGLSLRRYQTQLRMMRCCCCGRCLSFSLNEVVTIDL